MMKAVTGLFIAILFASPFTYSQAQPAIKESKPYKIITSGRQLIIKCSKPIDNVLVWTTDGNRIIEQKNINNSSFAVEIPVNRKAFYLMIGLVNGKIYTEKIGVL